MSTVPHRFPGVYLTPVGGRDTLCTRSMVPHQSVYGEKIISTESGDFRIWLPRRSKLGAALQLGMNEMPIQPGSRVLYLGAASGTTVSHVSDIVGETGVVFAVEFSPQVTRKLIQLAESRPNILPIVDDARYPSRYSSIVTGSIDVVYQDVAQPKQAQILVENMKAFCSFGAWGMIAIKARSIDSTSSLSSVYSKELKALTDNGLEIVENLDLAPLEKDHRFVVVRMAGANY
jgi:fibrillarin-like pre-rRNA processing protein